MVRRLPLACLMLVLTVSVCRAEELVWATGRVLGKDGKGPLRDAIVAVYDDKNRVVDYARTDAEGNYTLAIPRTALHLDKKGGGGFLHQVVGGVGRLVGGVAGPIKTGLRAAASAVPAADPISKAGLGAASGIAQNLVDAIAPPRRTRTAAEFQPGALIMKVTAAGHNDVVAPARVYWMEEQLYTAKGREQRALTAWFDPANLVAAGNQEPSTIASDYLTFTSARLEPSIAQPGQRVNLTVTMPLPADPHTPAVVIARNNRTGRTYELQPAGDGVYHTEFEIDKSFPRNDQVLTVIAYAEQPDRPGRSKKVEDALLHAGMLNPQKPYAYNPLLVVSRNRAEAGLTVVAPPRGRR